MWGDLKRQKVGGITTFWGPGIGPLTVGLTFRVGIVDERIPIRGITHMVEHLALQRLGRQHYTYNAFVNHLRTTFFATGSPAEITDFLNSVSTAVADLPLERLEHERRVLLTESERHAPGWLDMALSVRYGARGPGVASHPEFGLHGVTEDDIRAWAQRYFRAENAVLWLNGPPPPDLVLDLPSGGSRVEVPQIDPVPFDLPAWYEAGERGVGASSIVPRSVGSTSLTAILEHRLIEELRYRRGISYDIGCGYVPLSGDLALQSVSADALKENTDEVRDVIVETLESLGESGPSEEEIAQHKSDFARISNDPNGLPAVADAQSLSYLLRPEDAERDVLAEMHGLKGSDVKEAAARFAAAALFMVPQGAKMPRGYNRIPEMSSKKFRGKTYRPSRRSEAMLSHHRLVEGAEGITWIEDRGRFVSVAFDACEGLVQWRDGSRLLLGSDGFMIHIYPQDWRRGGRLIEAIDDRLSDRAVLMRSDPPTRTPPSWDRGTYLRWALISGFFAVGAIANLFDPSHQADGSWVFFLVMGLILLPLTVFNGAKYFRLRRRKG